MTMYNFQLYIILFLLLITSGIPVYAAATNTAAPVREINDEQIARWQEHIAFGTTELVKNIIGEINRAKDPDTYFLLTNIIVNLSNDMLTTEALKTAAAVKYEPIARYAPRFIESDNDDLLIAAIKTCGVFNTTATTAAIKKIFLEDEDTDKKRAAIQALAAMHAESDDVRMKCVALVNRRRTPVNLKTDCIHALGAFSNASMISNLTYFLKTKRMSADVKAAAAMALASFDTPAVIEILHTATDNNKDWFVRMQCIYSLSKLSGSQVDEYLLRRMRDNDERIRLAALKGLAHRLEHNTVTDNDQYTDMLAYLMQNDTNKNVRNKAAELLCRLNTQKSTHAIDEALEKNVAGISKMLYYYIHFMPPEAALSRLKKEYERSEELTQKNSALIAIARLDTSEAYQYLTAIINTPNREQDREQIQEKIMIVQACSKNGNNGLPVIKAGIENPDIALRCQGILMLTTVDKNYAAPIVRNIINTDDNPFVLLQAIKTISYFELKENAPALKTIAAYHNEAWLKGEARTALRAWNMNWKDAPKKKTAAADNSDTQTENQSPDTPTPYNGNTILSNQRSDTNTTASAASNSGKQNNNRQNTSAEANAEPVDPPPIHDFLPDTK